MACDVCGRTLLRGEHADTYLAGGERRQVCDLCTARAQHEGWIRESGGDELGVRSARQERRSGLLDRLRARRERAREIADEGELPAAEELAAPRARRGRRRADEADAVPYEVPREPRHVRAVPTNAELKMQRALEIFNASDFTRTVGGVARSLGAPGVCVRPLTDRPSVVTITVVWELSWYRFEVDLSDEAGGVRRDAQGAESDDLAPAELEVNAAADERGALHLSAA
jgi:hypothetical protein